MTTTITATTTVARGAWQRDVLRAMLNGGTVNPVSMLRGKARNYELRYRASFRALLARCERAGYTVERTPGVHGGEWSAVYRIVF